MIPRRIAAIGCWAGVLIAATPALAAESPLVVARGREIARTRCSACHAVGWQGESPKRDAPPFRRLHENYPVADLIGALSQGAPPSRPGMHRFRLGVSDARALTAYIQSLPR